MVKRKMMDEFPAILEFTGRIFFISSKIEELFLSRALSTLPQVLILPGSKQLEIFWFKAHSLWILWQGAEHKGHLQRTIWLWYFRPLPREEMNLPLCCIFPPMDMKGVLGDTGSDLIT